MEQWLVRTAQNWIAGPYLKEQVCQMILDRKLKLDDEVCAANGYWIFLHEREEVRELLGIEVPQTQNRDGDDVTETLTTAGDVTDPAISVAGLNRKTDTESEITSVLSADSLKELRSHRKKSASTHGSGVRSKKVAVKKKPIGRMIAQSLLILSCILIGLYFWLLYRSYRSK